MVVLYQIFLVEGPVSSAGRQLIVVRGSNRKNKQVLFGALDSRFFVGALFLFRQFGASLGEEVGVDHEGQLVDDLFRA